MDMEIKIIRTENPKAKPTDESKLGFGKIFTDHMFAMDYTEAEGWHNARIQPYQPYVIDPASPVLHYGQEIFEGLKAYRTAEGSIQLFRPIENARRMNASAERLCMPTIDEDFQVKAMKALVEMEAEWVPHSPGTSLYLRPTMFGDGAALGVHPAPVYHYFIITAPSGAYYARGMAPVRIHIEDQYVRAVRGGVGFTKTGGNYAASLKAGAEAEATGYDQVLWLDGRENKYVEEVGAMNMMFVIGNSLCTPALEGSILPGITRKSVLALAADRGLKVEERRISVDELLETYAAGNLKEAFGTGTAAVISPVGELEYKGQHLLINNGEIGPVAKDMYQALTSIQNGSAPDPYGWIVKVC